MIGEWLRRLRYYFRRRAFEAELEEELQHHVALAGRKQFGNVTRVQEESRAAWGWRLVEQLGQDLRYAGRTMAAHRLFTALVVVSLALGIGANTAIFSFVDALLLRPLPVQDPDSLVTLHWHTKAWPQFPIRGGGTWYRDLGGVTGANLPYAALDLFGEQNRFFSSVIGYSSWGADELNVVAGGEARVVAGQRVSGNFFETLGVRPAAGRLIQPDDDRPGAPLVAVISHAMWVSRFGGSAAAIGRPMRVNNHRVTVIGVTPPGFRGPGFMLFEKGRDLYLPLHTPALVDTELLRAANDPRYTDDGYYWVEVAARLQPGVRRQDAARALEPLLQRFVSQVDGPATRNRANLDASQPVTLPSFLVKPGGRGSTALTLQYGQQIWILMTLVALILAIACANVANLLLARGTARQRELAVRLSVGASRGRVIRQLLTESVWLAVLGGAGGVAVAVWGMRFLTALLGGGQENFLLAPELNWRVLAAAAAVSVVTGLLFGLAPALRATRLDVFPTLKESRAGVAPRRFRLRPGQALVAAQIAISLLLLVAASLFLRTLANVRWQDVGFDARNVLLLRTDPAIAGYTEDAGRIRLYADLRAKLAALPGVRAVSESEIGLLEGIRRSMDIRVPEADSHPEVTTFANGVGPRFLSTMGIPVLAGREIDERDVAAGLRVAVVNQQFAETYFPGQYPVGRRFQYVVEEEAWDYEVVGVVGRVRTDSLRRSFAYFWLPYTADTRFDDRMSFAMRTEGDPLGLAAAARRVVRDADERLPVEIETQQHRLDAVSREEEMFATLAGGFALLALGIAGVGLYGSVAYTVARRTNEIGIRMALGAQRGRVVWMVVRQVAMLIGVGLAIGVPAALAGSRFVASFLYGLEPTDPLAMAAAVGILLVAAAMAAAVPARRASRIDPMTALRHE